MNWDREVDVVVVGSGLGAMTSALCLKEMGVESIEVIEKGDMWGGTSGVSGGGIWIPNSHYAKEAGGDDSIEDATTYLGTTIPDGMVPQNLIDSYLENAPKMLKFVADNSEEVIYESLAHYPDYYNDNPGSRSGHRSLEPATLDIAKLGKDGKTMVPTHHMMYMFDRIGFTQVEANTLVTRPPGWWMLAVKLVLQHIIETPWRIKNKTKRARRLATGCAGTARMFLALKNRNIPVTLNCGMKDLIKDENGRIIGITAEENGKEITIKANKGVILGSGGFEYNQQLREKYLPQPTSTEWSGGEIRTNTGDALVACEKLNTKMRLMNGAWWCTTIRAPDEPAPRLAIMEKSLPGNVVVNMNGKRISNESQNYMAYQTELFESHSEENPNSPAYMVFDRRFRESYMVGPLMDTMTRPDSAIPKSYFENGFMALEDSIEAIADKLGINKENLVETINNMNEYAKTGKDMEFGRGDTAYDKYYGDVTVEPNPCLHAIDQGPFYAIRIDPGDFGTHGGMDTNVHAQVLSADNDQPIEGLYAVGNCAAAILPTYPGPGSTLGPAMTWGYQAAKHITGHKG